MQIIILLIITIFIELITAWLIGKKPLRIDNPWRLSSIAITGANLISYPLAWLLFEGLQIITVWKIAFIITEVMVIFLEARLLTIQLSLSFRESFFISFCMNVVSAALGVILWLYFFGTYLTF